ncbi:hypothetical protein [Alloalcanivorax mobilis]|uniref:hypothetical protein n=1 Tax=Alloalcanivorax mobilis TaxID=2019569 RepID=UPI000C78E2DB|nr:hypothetical protein [Alloalcanivorax mobilis]
MKNNSEEDEGFHLNRVLLRYTEVFVNDEVDPERYNVRTCSLQRYELCEKVTELEPEEGDPDPGLWLYWADFYCCVRLFSSEADTLAKGFVPDIDIRAHFRGVYHTREPLEELELVDLNNRQAQLDLGPYWQAYLQQVRDMMALSVPVAVLRPANKDARNMPPPMPFQRH